MTPIEIDNVIASARLTYPEAGPIKLLAWDRDDGSREWQMWIYSVPTTPTGLVRHMAAHQGKELAEIADQLSRLESVRAKS